MITKTKRKSVPETVRIVLCNNRSGIYTLDELKKFCEEEKKKKLLRKGSLPMSEDFFKTERFIKAKWREKIRLAFVYVMRNTRAESRIPDDVICNIARYLLPNIIAFFESEKGRAEFEQWKTEQEQTSERARAPAKEKNGEHPRSNP